MNPEPEFYLASGDTPLIEQPRACFPIQRVRVGIRDDGLLMRVNPPIAGDELGVPGQLGLVIAVPRLQGGSLFPISAWPVDVYLCAPTARRPESRKTFRAGQYTLIAWAELYPTHESAQEMIDKFWGRSRVT